MQLLLPVEWMKHQESGMLPLLFFKETDSMQRDNQWNERKSAKGKEVLLHRCAASSQTSLHSPTRFLRDSEVPKSTRAAVRVSSVRARGKRPAEVNETTWTSYKKKKKPSCCHS